MPPKLCRTFALVGSASSLRRLAAAAVAAAGCASHAPPDPAPPARIPSTEQSFSLNQGALHVSLRIPDAPPGRKPVLLSPFGDPEALLARGVIVATYQVDWTRVRELIAKGTLPAPAAPKPEPAGAPEQPVGTWLLASPRPGIIGRSYFQLIRVDAEQTVPAVVDLLVTLPEVDAQRIAIAGSSTQGFVALEALRREPRLAAGVVRVACGDYPAFLRSSNLALGDDPRWLPDGKLQLDADYAAELAQHQPIATPEAYPPRPLLLIAGEDDRVIPLACVERTDAIFTEAYARAGVPERFHVDVLPGAGHDVGAQTEELALAWIDRWLVAGAPR